MSRSVRRRTAAAILTGAVVAGLALSAAGAPAFAGTGTGTGAGLGASDQGEDRGARAKHVLLLSVDGLHAADLAQYVATHPRSNLARLERRGVTYTNAKTPFPSDSFPGLVGIVTGGNPKTTGVYYDDTWNHALLPAGTTNCAGVAPGAEVSYTEQLDKNQASIDAGQGLAGLPGSILNLTSDAASLIDPSQLPVDPATCTPVYPHTYLQTNTIFEVARAAGLRTAWSDKHPAYEIVDGPSGTGVQDFFTPEINSDAPTVGSPIDWTKDNALTRQYDGYKVDAVLNEIKGLDHSGTKHVGVPNIFGMNFQSVSTAQKLPKSDGLAGGYLADGVTPGPLLRGALDFVDQQVGRMRSAIAAAHLTDDTTIVLTAKHGQSPTEPAALTRIDDGAIMDGLNAAWAVKHPGATLVAFSVNDDVMLIWLTDRSPEAAAFAKQYLLGLNGTGNGIDGAAKPYTASGLSTVYAGADAASFIGVQAGDARVPDLIGIAQHGVVYTGKKSKIAEHGGADAQDRDVALVVSGGGFGADEQGDEDGQGRPAVVTSAVETTQIAPTVLRLLGLDPRALHAVQVEHTAVLPLR